MKLETLFAQIFVLLCLQWGLVSCRYHQTATYDSFEEMAEEFDRMSEESSVTWKELIVFVDDFLDSLYIRALDTTNHRNRLVSIYYSYALIDLMENKYVELTSAGKKANHKDFLPYLDHIYDITHLWFCDEQEANLIFWHDHFYICNKDSDHPVPGFFHIRVTKSSDSLNNLSGEVYFPMAAEDSVSLFFSRDTGDDTEYDVIDALDCDEKVIGESPIIVHLDASLVKKMLTWDIMYFSFQSQTTEGDRFNEMARLDLTTFQEVYAKY